MGGSMNFMSWLEKRRADRERDEKVLKLIESMPDTVVIFKDGEGHWLRANKKAIELFRLEGVKYFGKIDKELAEYSIAPEAMLNCIETDNNTWLQGKATRIEERVIGKEKKKKQLNCLDLKELNTLEKQIKS